MLIALVRHLADGLLNDEAAVSFSAQPENVEEIVEFLVARARAASGGLEDEDTEQHLRGVMHTWKRRAHSCSAEGERLLYWEKRAPFGRTAPHLMYASEQLRPQDSPAWATPNSMRDVEPSTAFVLKRISRKGKGNDGKAS